METASDARGKLPRLAYAMAALTLAALALGIALAPVVVALASGQAEAPAGSTRVLLIIAEIVKLASAGVMWRIAGLAPAQPAGMAAALRIAALLLALAGLAGLAGVLLGWQQASQAVQVLALGALLATAAWGIACGRAMPGGRTAMIAAAGITLAAALATLAFPPAGLAAALAQIVFWRMLGRGAA